MQTVPPGEEKHSGQLCGEECRTALRHHPHHLGERLGGNPQKRGGDEKEGSRQQMPTGFKGRCTQQTKETRGVWAHFEALVFSSWLSKWW